MGITDFSTAVQWRALAQEALQGPRATALGRLQSRKWLWAGGAVLGGFQARACLLLYMTDTMCRQSGQLQNVLFMLGR